MAQNKVAPYTIQRCFYKAGFLYKNEQSRIEDPEATSVNNLASILQELHTEIEPVAYLKANESLPICDNNIAEEKEDNTEKAEPGKIN